MDDLPTSPIASPFSVQHSCFTVAYQNALDFLFTLPRFGHVGAAAYRPGQARMWALLEAMGYPHEQLEAIHVAGTNGKGSTASMVAAIGMASGRRTGLHTSPHLFDFAERMRIDGNPAPHDWVMDAVSRFKGDVKRIEPSFFEASVALSFLYFAEEAVDLAVVEVGLGGRLDATNVLSPRACAVTHIGLDHTELLGDSLGAIAREKGGIAKQGVPLLSAVEDGEASAALRETAQKAGAKFENVRETTLLEVINSTSSGLVIGLQTPVRPYKDLKVELSGVHQAWNAALAVRLAETAWPDIQQETVRTGLADVVAQSGLRGRCEVMSEHPRIIADVAHNPDGWHSALTFAKPKQEGQLYVLVGVMEDKDVAALAALLAEHEAVALPVGLPSPRAMPKSALSEILQATGVSVVDVPGVVEGIGWFCRRAEERDVLLITGSHLAVAALGDYPFEEAVEKPRRMRGA